MSGVREVLAWLREAGSPSVRDGLLRYGIVAPKAFGVPVAVLKRRAEALGRDHALAAALWRSGWYEARLLAAFVDDPARVTAEQMERWLRDFDNWAVCDTVCFHLFDRAAPAWGKVARWARRRAELEKRAAFALLASLALHDREAPDARFVAALALVEGAAADGRNFVRKGVSWALRVVGRRNAALHAEALTLARRLAAAEAPSARTTGREASRELTGAVVRRHLARQAARGRPRT